MTDSHNGPVELPMPGEQGKVVRLQRLHEVGPLTDESSYPRVEATAQSVDPTAEAKEREVGALDLVRRIHDGEDVGIINTPPRPKLRIVEESPVDPEIAAARLRVEASGPELSQYFLDKMREEEDDGDLPPAA
jgi:hypothetical protein